MNQSSKAVGWCCIFYVVLALCWLILPHPAIFPVLCFIPLAIMFVIRWPFIICLGFIVFSFFRLHEAFPFLEPFKFPLLLALASIFSLAWHLFVSKKINPYMNKELKLFFMFFLLVTLGIAGASNIALALSAWSSNYVKIAIMVFAIAWLTRTPKDCSLATTMFILCGVLIALVALYNKVSGIGLVEDTRVTISREIGSVLGDPNDLALILLFPISFCAAVSNSSGHNVVSRIMALVCFVVISSAIIATQSRGGLLGLLTIMGTFSYQRIKSKVLLFSIGGLAMIALLLMAGISDRSSGGAGESGVDQSAMGRIYAWEAAFNMALQHPLTGIGLDNFLENYFFYTTHWDGMVHAVHSTWFGVLAETGFIGLAIFLYLIKLVLASMLISIRVLEAINHPRTDDKIILCMAWAVFSGCLGFIVSGTFLTQGFTWPVYILIALAVAIKKQTDTASLFALQNANIPKSTPL